MNKEKCAVIDIGSNSIRLVIYEKSESGKYKVRENIKAVARLRHYLRDDQILSEEGIDILLHTLKGFKEINEFHQIEEIECVATATIRQARNQNEILAAVYDKTGFSIKVLSEEEEAFYGFYAVTHTTPIETGITIDMGGGSTEVTYFKNRTLIHSHSFPFGVVSLKEQFIKGDKITIEERNLLISFIQESFQQIPWLENLQVPIIAIGGSARNIAQINQNFKKYPIAGIHQYVMTHDDLLFMQQYLERMSIKELEKVEGLSKDRADIIVPALEMFLRICEYSQSTVFMFSRKGLRDGVSLKKSKIHHEAPSTEEIVHDSLNELLMDYAIDRKRALHIGLLARQLFTAVCQYHAVHQPLETALFTERGAKAYYLGNYVNDEASSQHTFYLLANQSIDGLHHKERVKLALIASYKNKTLLKQYSSPFEKWFSKEELEDIRLAGIVAKLAAALDASKRSIVSEVSIREVNNELLNLEIDSNSNSFVEQYEVGKHIRHLEKMLRKEIQVNFKFPAN